MERSSIKGETPSTMSFSNEKSRSERKVSRPTQVRKHRVARVKFAKTKSASVCLMVRRNGGWAPLPIPELQRQVTLPGLRGGQLSGSHGSWTRSDDVKGQKQKPRRKQRVVETGGNKPASARRGASAEDIAALIARYAGRALGGPAAEPVAEMFVRQIARHFKGKGDVDTVLSVMPVKNSIIHGPATVETSYGNSLHKHRVRHRELVATIRTGTVAGAPVIMSFTTNPVDPTFPLTSQFARLFQLYAWDGMVWEYQTMVSMMGTGTVGSITMAWSCNAGADPPASVEAAMQYDNGVTAPLYKGCMYAVECKRPPLGMYYTRRSAAEGDVQLAEMGRMHVAINPAAGLGADTALGNLFVTFDLDLQDLIPLGVGDYYHTERTGAVVATPLGTATTTSVAANGVFENTVITGTTLDIPAPVGAVVSVRIYWYGASAVAFTVPTPTVTNGTPVNILNNRGTSLLAIPNTLTSTTAMFEGVYRSASRNNVPMRVSFAGGSLPGAPCRAEVLLQLLGIGAADTSL